MNPTNSSKVKKLNTKELLFYVKGEWVPESKASISVLDYGFQYGDGVFEGIRIYNGTPFKIEEHLDRLMKSLYSIQIDIPLTKEALKEICMEFIERNNIENGHMKIVITRGQGYRMAVPDIGPNIVIYGRLLGTYFSKDRGLKLKTSSVRRNPPECLDPRIKSLNYLNNVLSRLEAYSSGCDDSLQLDMEGFVSESSGANIFIIKDGILKTPRKYNILDGITRSTVIDIAKKIGFDIIEDNFTLYDVYNADEVFLCGSAAEITPVSEVDGRKIIGTGEITKKIQQIYHELTHN